MTVSVRHGLESTYHEAGYVSLCIVKQDGLTFYEVSGRDGGYTFRLPFDEADEARDEYRRRVRSVGSMA